jgi:hypothetical protein
MVEDPLTALPESKRREVLAKEEELVAATEALHDVCETIPIVLVPTMVDARFTPQAWMLVLEATYCVMYFFMCVYESATMPGYSMWLIYEAVYFRYVNSPAAIDLLVNAALRRVYLDEPMLVLDPFFVTGAILVAPALITHIIPGIALYGWVILGVLLVWLPLCWTMRQLEKRFFFTMDPMSIFFRVVFRLGTTLIVTLLMQSSFNWALLYYDKKDGLAYLGILLYEYNSRSWGCFVESRLMSLANAAQFISAFV